MVKLSPDMIGRFWGACERAENLLTEARRLSERADALADQAERLAKEAKSLWGSIDSIGLAILVQGGEMPVAESWAETGVPPAVAEADPDLARAGLVGDPRQ